MPIIVGITVGITLLLLFVPPFTKFFQFERLAITQILISIALGAGSVLWYEGVKWRKRILLKPITDTR